MYQIISPDGFPISQDTYSSIKKALAAFENWKDGFKQQGFYSTIYNGMRLRIPLEDLKDNCELVKI